MYMYIYIDKPEIIKFTDTLLQASTSHCSHYYFLSGLSRFASFNGLNSPPLFILLIVFHTPTLAIIESRCGNSCLDHTINN